MEPNKFYFKKALGQNFLTDKNIIRKIAGIINDLNPGRIFEIGPGRGDIAMLFEDRIDLVLIEKDERLIDDLRKKLKSAEIINSDIRDIHLEDYSVSDNDLLFSNLPYSSSTSILQHLLSAQPPFGNYLLMFQKEVAERIRADANDRDYGYISIFTSLFCSIRKLFTLPPSVFFPRPKVFSELLLLTPHKKRYFSTRRDIERFCTFIKTAFSKKRKKLKSNLCPFYHFCGDISGLVDLRPHQLSMEEYIELFNRLQDQ